MAKKHPKKCECPTCLATKIQAFKKRVQMMHQPNPPTVPEAQVPVRAHFRRQKNYLKNQPQLRDFVFNFVSALYAQGLAIEEQQKARQRKTR